MKKKRGASKIIGKVIGRITPKKLSEREQGQLSYMEYVVGAIIFILVAAILNALAVEFFGIESLL